MTIKVGDILSLKGSPGTAEIIRKSAGGNFFWARVSLPSSKMHNGQEFPFANDGRYLGSVNWALPDLVPHQEEIIEVEL